MTGEIGQSEGLARLEAALERDFERLNHPPAGWVRPMTDRSGRAMTDVAIIGGGMCGLAAAFALRRLGVSNIVQVDRAPEGREGPWLTYARMRTLRSPKHLTGPVIGFANLTFRAWYEAQRSDWTALDRITRADWMAYLRWYRKVTGARVENGIDVVAVRPEAEEVELTLRDGRTMCARQVVLATGRDGQAARRIPAPLAPFVGAEVRHTSDDIDFSAVSGRRVAVIGLAASAFDNAAMALEAGAAAVTLIGRAAALPRLNKMKQTVYPGFTHGFAALPDEDKLAFLDHVMQHRIAPPRSAVQRVSTDARLTLMLATEITGAARGGGLMLETTGGPVAADLVILGTGAAVDLDAPGEIAGFADDILRWGDRITAATGEWAAFPYLGPGFEFLPRENPLPGLDRVRCFTHAAQLSLGNLSNDIPTVSEGAEQLARTIASALFVEDRAWHLARLQAYDELELLGDEWPGLDAWDPPIG